MARTDFKQHHPHRMLAELSACVAETLQETYPEVGENLNKVNITYYVFVLRRYQH